jgi:hypothetical protein
MRKIYRCVTRCISGPPGCSDEHNIYGEWKYSEYDVLCTASDEIRKSALTTPYMRSYNKDYWIEWKYESDIISTSHRIEIYYC